MSITVFSPTQGRLIQLENVCDEVFSQKILGDGVSIEPVGDEAVFCSPCDGVLSTIFRTGHAFVVQAGKAEVLVHIGIDTTTLNGEGFEVLKKDGDKVCAGDPVVRVDLAFLRSHNKPLSSPVLVSNMDDISEIKLSANAADDVTTKTPIFTIHI